jgi:hypothetical protein
MSMPTIKTPVVLDADRYWWIIRPAGAIGEICRVRKDLSNAEAVLGEIFVALNTATAARTLVLTKAAED